MDSRVQIVVAYLDRNLHQDLSVTSLAHALNISPSRLRHLFKEDLGISFAVYFKLLRMRKAKELIETTFLSVKEIMHIIGVSDESHFVRDFKKIYGLPPRKYRSRYLNSRANDSHSAFHVAISAKK